VDNTQETNQIINSALAGFLSANLARLATENKAAIIDFVNELLGRIGS